MKTTADLQSALMDLIARAQTGQLDALGAKTTIGAANSLVALLSTETKAQEMALKLGQQVHTLGALPIGRQSE
jgi:hypothetical protein